MSKKHTPPCVTTDEHAGYWIEYVDTEVYKGARVPSGTRLGILVSVGRSWCKVIFNGPTPRLIRVHLDDVRKVDRLARVGECSDRITSGLAFGARGSAINALRAAREAVRAARSTS